MKVKRKKTDKNSMRILRRLGAPDPTFEAVESAPINEREERESRLSLAAANQMNRFTNPYFSEIGVDGEFGSDKERDGLRLDESHPLAKDYIENELFANLGFDGNSSEDAWSAATVSDLAKAYDPDFEGSVRHSDYIRRAFRGEGNYRAEENRRDTEYQPGDILFQGRRERIIDPDTNEVIGYRNLGPQTYDEFALDGEGGGDWSGRSGYGSHSDVIVGTGTEPILNRKGKQKTDLRGRPRTRTYYDVQGGNVGDTLNLKRYFADDIRRRYAGRLTQ